MVGVVHVELEPKIRLNADTGIELMFPLRLDCGRLASALRVAAGRAVEPCAAGGVSPYRHRRTRSDT